MKPFIILATLLGIVALASGAHALTFENPLGVSTIGQLLDRVISFMIAISVPILTAVVLYAGFIMITSEGNPDKFHQGIMVIVYAAVGFGIILIAKGVAIVIAQIL